MEGNGLINQTIATTDQTPTDETFDQTFKRPSSAKDRPALGEIIRAYKAAITRCIRQSGETGFGWQRNYYEHIIRDETALNALREYIHNNPVRWHLDRYNAHSGNRKRSDWVGRE